jgi:hypothetical protein
MMMLFTGSKYLEHISRIMVMHNGGNNWTQLILNKLTANLKSLYDTQYEE